jgi:hypothetical protein
MILTSIALLKVYTGTQKSLYSILVGCYQMLEIDYQIIFLIILFYSIHTQMFPSQTA